MTTFLFLLFATEKQRIRFENWLRNDSRKGADEVAKVFVARYFSFWQRLGLVAFPLATIVLITVVLALTFLVALNSIAHPYPQL